MSGSGAPAFSRREVLAARVVEDGGVRLLRGQARAPLDKPSRPVRCGDVLSFAQGSRWIAVKVEALGERRGPAPEARALYSALTDAGGGAQAQTSRRRQPDAQSKAVTLTTRVAKLKNALPTRGCHETHSPCDACRSRHLRFLCADCRSLPRRPISSPPHRAISSPRTPSSCSVGRRRVSTPSSRA